MKREVENRTNSSLAHKRTTSRYSGFQAHSPIKFRRKHSHIFQICYTELCSHHNIPMIFPIKAHLHKRMLDFNGDRVKLDEWRPILKALSLDRSLHFIAIRSKNSYSKVLERMDSETKARTVNKLPVLLTHFIFNQLISCLSRCLSISSHLRCLELDGLVLSGDYLLPLLSGLEKSTSLQHLSLHRCPLGDDGCQLVCNALRNSPNVLTLNMSGCNLSEKGASYVAKALQYQNLNRYGENWKQSLRYRTPDTDVMPGLRRVTLNHNPLIGDSGVGHILKVLTDDLWVKALDLQHVGLTTSGGMEVLHLLSTNKSLSVLDVHNNPDLDKSVFESIMNVLATNHLGKACEYHWIQEETLYLPRKPSYQSKDPSFVQRYQQGNEGIRIRSQLPGNGGRAVRLTKSSTTLQAASAQEKVTKTHSASSVTAQATKPLEKKAPQRALMIHSLGIKERLAQKPTRMNEWDSINASGDAGHANDMRAKLQELASKLEEETQKRIEAEKQKADLEIKLEKLSQEQEGQIIMDANVVNEITEAFDAFNSFIAIFSERGIHFETAADSDGLSTQALSETMSNQSQPLSKIGDFEMLDLDDSSGLACPFTTMTIQERSSNVDVDYQHPDPSRKCKNREEVLIDGLLAEKDLSPPCHQQKVLNEIFQSDKPTLQLTDLLKTDAISFVSNRQSNMPQKLAIMGSAGTTPRNEGNTGSVQGVCSDLFPGSTESLYTNAEQPFGNDPDESNGSWTTQSCYSADTSPASTLTELTIK